MGVQCNTYRKVLKLHSFADVDVHPEMIKKKIRDNIQDVEFSRPKENRPELLCSVSTKKNAAVGQSSEHCTMEAGFKKEFDTACLVRKAIIQHRDNNPWIFEGSLNSGSEDIPPILYNLERAIIEGPETGITVGGKRMDVLKTATNISKSIMYVVVFQTNQTCSKKCRSRIQASVQ